MVAGGGGGGGGTDVRDGLNLSKERPAGRDGRHVDRWYNGSAKT